MYPSLTPRLPLTSLISLISRRVCRRVFWFAFRNMLFLYICICSLLYDRLPRSLLSVPFMLGAIVCIVFVFVPFSFSFDFARPFESYKLHTLKTKPFSPRKNAIATRQSVVHLFLIRKNSKTLKNISP